MIQTLKLFSAVNQTSHYQTKVIKIGFVVLKLHINVTIFSGPWTHKSDIKKSLNTVCVLKSYISDSLPCVINENGQISTHAAFHLYLAMTQG